MKSFGKFFSATTALSLVSQGAWISLRYGVVALCGLLVSVVFARYASKSAFGEYQYILALVTLFSVFSLPGLNLVALKGVVEKNSGIITQVVQKSFLLAWIGAFGMTAYILSQSDWGNLTFVGTVILAAFLLPFYAAFNTWYTYYEGRLIFRPVAFRIILQTLTVSFLLMLGIWLQWPLYGLVAIFLAGNALWNSVYFWEVKKKIAAEENAVTSHVDMKEGTRITLQKFAVSLNESLPALILPLLFGLEGLAIFQMAFLFYSSVSGLLSGLSASYLPSLFHTQSSYTQQLFQNALIGGIMFLLFRILLEVIFLPLYGVSYQESFELAKIFSWLILFLPLRIFFVNFLTVNKGNRDIVILYVGANILSLGILALLRDTSLVTASGTYFVCLQALLFAFTALVFFSRISWKTSSIS